jgi:predicted ATPase
MASVLAASMLPARFFPLFVVLAVRAMARLDRLGSAKEVAQIGVAIGREFSQSLLAEVMREAEAELVSALDRLVAAGWLFRRGT